MAIHAALLPTGKVMFFSYPTYPNRPNNAEAYLWDPAQPNVPPVIKNPPGKANIWCAGQTFAANGELVVFGGNLDYEFPPSQTWKGLDRVFTFNPWSETWTEQPKMAHGRWYPTGVRRPTGGSQSSAGWTSRACWCRTRTPTPTSSCSPRPPRSAGWARSRRSA